MPSAPNRVCYSIDNEGHHGMEVRVHGCHPPPTLCCMGLRTSCHGQVEDVAWVDAFSVASSLNICPRVIVSHFDQLHHLIIVIAFLFAGDGRGVHRRRQHQFNLFGRPSLRLGVARPRRGLVCLVLDRPGRLVQV